MSKINPVKKTIELSELKQKLQSKNNIIKVLVKPRRYWLHIIICVIAAFVVYSNIYAQSENGLYNPFAEDNKSIIMSYLKIKTNNQEIVETAESNITQLEKEGLNFSSANTIGAVAAINNIAPKQEIESSTTDKRSVTLAMANTALISQNPPQTIIPQRKTTKVTEYEVKGGQTISEIALKNGVSTKNLLQSNLLSEDDFIHPGDILKIPPSAYDSIVITTDREYTVSEIAEKYSGNVDDIKKDNELNSDIVEPNRDLIIRDGELPPPPKPEPEPENDDTRLAYAREDDSYYSDESSDGYGGADSSPCGNHFAYGYCTWYVANKRCIPWFGNANAWIYNAQAMGYATGSEPAVGAVYVEPWLSGWGHVSYVESINGDGTFTVSEMNYIGWNTVSYRTISVGAGGTFIY